MDSVINKLRNTVSTVTSTVSQLSVVLPGNPVCREYELVAQVGSAGPGLLWKIYSGYKKSTRQAASVFIFEKKDVDKWSKKDRERIMDAIKRGVTQLTKLRHPRILTVQHPLEESRDSIAFAAEPVLASLANVLGNKDNLPYSTATALREYVLDEVEIKYGLLQVAEGLQFLHREKLIHGNLCPESIILSEQGSWKIAGFDFSIKPILKDLLWDGTDLDDTAHPNSRPNLDYVPPEYEKFPVPASDLFALGVLTFAAYNKGETVFPTGGSLHACRNNFAKLERGCDPDFRKVPAEIHTFLRSLLQHNPDGRPDAHDYSKLSYFALDERVKTLSYLDSLFQLDNLQKSKFFKGLHTLLEKLPHRVRLFRVVPCLANELVNPPMVPFILPNLLSIVDWSTEEEFSRHLLQPMRTAMKIKDPVQVSYIVLKNMELIIKKAPDDFQKTDLLPLVYAALDNENDQMQELALGVLPTLFVLLDHGAVKNIVLPRIRKITLSTQSQNVRMSCLMCLGYTLPEIEKWLVMDFVLPFITEIPNRESVVVTAILMILKAMARHRRLGLTKELIATRVLPFLFPITIENGLTKDCLENLLGFIHELIEQVAREQTAKFNPSTPKAVNDSPFPSMEELFPGMSNGTPKPKLATQSFAEWKQERSKRPPTPTNPPPPWSQPKDMVHTLMDSQIDQLMISSNSNSHQQQPTITPFPFPAVQQPRLQQQQQQSSQQPQQQQQSSQQQLRLQQSNYAFHSAQLQPQPSVLSLPVSSQKSNTSLIFQQKQQPPSAGSSGAKALSKHDIDELLN